MAAVASAGAATGGGISLAAAVGAPSASSLDFLFIYLLPHYLATVAIILLKRYTTLAVIVVATPPMVAVIAVVVVVVVVMVVAAAAAAKVVLPYVESKPKSVYI